MIGPRPGGYVGAEIAFAQAPVPQLFGTCAAGVPVFNTVGVQDTLRPGACGNRGRAVLRFANTAWVHHQSRLPLVPSFVPLLRISSVSPVHVACTGIDNYKDITATIARCGEGVTTPSVSPSPGPSPTASTSPKSGYFKDVETQYVPVNQSIVAQSLG